MSVLRQYIAAVVLPVVSLTGCVSAACRLAVHAYHEQHTLYMANLQSIAF
jgi:hypothetical protein